MVLILKKAKLSTGDIFKKEPVNNLKIKVINKNKNTSKE